MCMHAGGRAMFDDKSVYVNIVCSDVSCFNFEYEMYMYVCACLELT